MFTPFLMWQFSSGNPFKASHSKVRNMNVVCVREGMALSGVPAKWQQLDKIGIYPSPMRSEETSIRGCGRRSSVSLVSQEPPLTQTSCPCRCRMASSSHTIVPGRRKKEQKEWTLPREIQVDASLLYRRQKIIENWNLDQICFQIHQNLDFVCRWNSKNG